MSWHVPVLLGHVPDIWISKTSIFSHKFNNVVSAKDWIAYQRAVWQTDWRIPHLHLFADVTMSAISISFGLTIRNKLVYVWADDKVREFPREKILWMKVA